MILKYITLALALFISSRRSRLYVRSQDVRNLFFFVSMTLSERRTGWIETKGRVPTLYYILTCNEYRSVY